MECSQEYEYLQQGLPKHVHSRDASLTDLIELTERGHRTFRISLHIS